MHPSQPSHDAERQEYAEDEAAPNKPDVNHKGQDSTSLSRARSGRGGSRIEFRLGEMTCVRQPDEAHWSALAEGESPTQPFDRVGNGIGGRAAGEAGYAD